MIEGKFSIIIATYNGEKYIIDQLNSIRNQTITPEEVLIFDDCSCDNTCNIIKEFIRKYELNWRIFENRKNLGWRKNFIQGISKATQEYIFICDQDDIWEENKCEVMMEIMVNNLSCNLLLTNYKAFSMDRSVKIPYSMRHQKNDYRIRKITPEVKYFTSVFRPGCTYCFRKSFYDQIYSYWIESMAHDQFIFHLSLLFDSAYHVAFRSIRFRRHKENNTPVNKRELSSRICEIEESIAYLNLYNSFLGSQIAVYSYVKEILDNSISFFTLRKNFYCQPTLKKWLQLCLYYSDNYMSFRNLLGDLYIGIVKPRLIFRKIITFGGSK